MRALLPACALAVACALVRAADLARALPTGAARMAEGVLFALFLAALLLAVPWREVPRALPLAGLLAFALLLAQRVVVLRPTMGFSVGWTTGYGPMTTWPALALAGGGISLALPLGRAALLGATALALALALRAARRAPLAGGLLVSSCPTCLAPPLAMAAAAGLSVAPANPTSLLATLLDLAVPLAALAALAPRGAWLGLAPPVLALGDLASGTSDAADAIHSLYVVFNVVAILVTGAFLALLLAFAIRYRKRAGAEVGPMPPLARRRGINAAWTVGLLGLLVAMMMLSLGAQQAMESTSSPSAISVQATALQWGWSFTYPDNSTSLNVLRVPHGQEVVVHVTSRDVAHSLFVPDLGVQVNAIPGRVNSAHFTVLRPGTWTGQCAEYCGIGHTDMRVTVEAT